MLSSISFFTDHVMAPTSDKSIVTVIIILAMVTLSGTISFLPATKSSSAASQLKSLIKVTAMTKRKDVDAVELNVNSLVCGDIVYLAAGDMIPADLRLICGTDLFVSQSSMTGESIPIQKIQKIYP